MFVPKPMPRVQDASRGNSLERTYDYIIGDDDPPQAVSGSKAELQEKDDANKKIAILLDQPAYTTGQLVKGKVKINLDGPTKAESLIVAVWGQKPITMLSTGETKTMFVSQRYVELCKDKVFDKEEIFDFELPIVTPYPEIAANYKWYVGVSLLVNIEKEISDMKEIKVVDRV
ncbi:MAG: hypothetical protein ACPL0A_01785 [Candidatus Micrarchaeia archaeon]